ncbi:MAG: orotidine-5'-phosphate decarboxylase [Nitrospirae bacterium]|nr:orotidine-5'-phosphate decarboxylase [Nitrospirota bacterium]
MKSHNRIILALDAADFNDAIKIIKKFRNYIDIFKVGSELFTAVGPKIVEEINSMGKKVFLDLKYHDIPTTVAKTARVVSKLRVFMFNIHTLGGFQMMIETTEALVKSSLNENIQRPLLLGVTILTSIDRKALSDELGISQNLRTQVRHLAGLALKAGLDGVVASPEDIETIRSYCGRGFLIITPGIRPSWAPLDDQKRTMTPKDALMHGANYIVIGRAVLSQPDPIKALERIEEEIASV